MADDDSADVGRPEAQDAAPAAPIILDMNLRHQLMLGALVHILGFAKCVLLRRILARGMAGDDLAKARDAAPDARISPFGRGLEEILHQLNDSQDGHAYAGGKMLIHIYRGLDVCQQFLLCIQGLDMNPRHQLMLGCLVHILGFAKCILLRRILARGMAGDDLAKARDAAPDARISPFSRGLEEILHQLNDSQDGHAYAGRKMLIHIYRGLDVCQQFLLCIQVLDMNPRHQLMLGCLVHILGFAKCVLLRRILARGMAGDDLAKAQDVAPDAQISPFGRGLEEILHQLNDSQDGHAYAGGKMLIRIYGGLDVCQQFLLCIQVLDMNLRHQLMLGCLVHILGFAKCVLLRRILVSRL